MRFWHLLTTRLGSLVYPGRANRELDEEIRLHLERSVEEKVAGGMIPAQSRYGPVVVRISMGPTVLCG